MDWSWTGAKSSRAGPLQNGEKRHGPLHSLEFPLPVWIWRKAKFTEILRSQMTLVIVERKSRSGRSETSWSGNPCWVPVANGVRTIGNFGRHSVINWKVDPAVWKAGILTTPRIRVVPRNQRLRNLQILCWDLWAGYDSEPVIRSDPRPSAVTIALLKSLPQHRSSELEIDSGISLFSIPISERSIIKSNQDPRLGSHPVWWKIVFKCLTNFTRFGTHDFWK